jgi:transposase
LICWVKSGVRRSSTCPATTPNGSPGRSPSAARPRSSPSIRFISVKAATDALDEIRREIWNEARRAGNKQLAKDLKGARFALWKNAEKPTDRQQHKLSSIQKTNQRLYRAYLLAQQLRQIYRVRAQDGLGLLEAWLKWARRSRLEPFRKLARRITDQRARVQAAFTNNLSNGLLEGLNSLIQAAKRRARGYRSNRNFITMIYLIVGKLNAGPVTA